MSLRLNIEPEFPLRRWKQMDAFLARGYGAHYVLRDKELFEWQFGRQDEPDMANIACAYQNDELIGILGYMPRRIFWGNTDRVIEAGWLANWLVLPEARFGMGWMLMGVLQKHFPVLLSIGLSQDNKVLASLRDFRIYERIDRALAVFSPDAVASMWFPDAGNVEEYCFPENKLQAQEKTGTVTELTLDNIAEAHMPDWSAYPQMAYGTIRDTAFLTRRFLKHPSFRYIILSTGSPQRPAICVARVQQTTGDTKIKVGRIVDFFHGGSKQDRENGRNVLSAMLARLANAGCAFADFYCTSAHFIDTATSTGMVAETGDGALPRRLNPVDQRQSALKAQAWVHKDLPPGPEMGALYFASSDGDQDRPNRPPVVQ